MTLSNQIDRVTGLGFIPQDIQEAAREIVLSENNAERLRAAKRFQNLVLASARDAQIQTKPRACTRSFHLEGSQ